MTTSLRAHSPLKRLAGLVAGAIVFAGSIGCMGADAPSQAPGSDTSTGANDANASGGDAAFFDASPQDTTASADTTGFSDTLSSSDGTGPDTDNCPPPNIEIIPGDPLVIPTREGPVVGVLADGVRTWLGVPFAAPPTGPRRFSAPVAPACRQSPLVASRFGAACPQTTSDGAVVGNEDCLTLNVWAPAPTPDEQGPWPVMVFIHGGGNIQGSASETLPGGEAIYDGQFLARFGRVVVVTLQYRLGALGWLVHPALDSGRADDAPANRGLLDQQHALRWINNHIGHFGGNREALVIFGESAGALNVGTHLVAPGSVGLFTHAILQSGTPRAVSVADAMEDGLNLIDTSVCGRDQSTDTDVRACLEALTTAEILAALPGRIRIGDPAIGGGASSFGPVFGDAVLPDAPLDALRARRPEAGPRPGVIVGSNADEMANLLLVQVDSMLGLEGAIKLHLGIPLAAVSGLDPATIATRILAVYDPSTYGSPQETLVDIYTDLRFTCPGVELLEALDGAGVSNGSAANTWRYLFARRAETRSGPQPASHGRELLYVFGTWRHIPLYRPAEADIALSDTMLRTWAAFATFGRPVVGTAATGPSWPAWTGTNRDTIIFDEKPRTEKALREDRCVFWQSFLGPSTR